MTPDNKPAASGLVALDVAARAFEFASRWGCLDEREKEWLRVHAQAARAALSQPVPSASIDMVLHCPKCGKQHIDWAEPAVEHDHGAIEFAAWDNPPHRSHLCHNCGHIWRPADVPTNGVAAVKTKGKEDSPIAVPSAPEPSKPKCSPTLTECPRCKNDVSKCPTFFAAPPVPAAAPAVEPVAWGIFDSQGFYEAAIDEETAKRFCTHYNKRSKDDPLRPYSFRPLFATLPASPEPATQGAAKPVHTDHPFQHWDRTCPACVLEASPPAPEPLTPAAGEPDERVLNLLARIHRDGGHYVAEHGLHKALQDAESIVIERIAALPTEKQGD